ncbi:MAG: GYD domain-containing protein [bacterium]|nr:GYD domain-containing protein [bacterium]
MLTYLLLVRNEPVGAQSMLESGMEGAQHQREAIEQLGARVLAQYALSGHYDAALIIEVPDEATARAIVLSAVANGQYVDDLQAFSPDLIDEARAVLSRPDPTATEEAE